MISRRELVLAGSALGLAPALAYARGLVTDATYLSIVNAALEESKRLGASYADVRIHRRREETVTTRDDHVDGVGDSERFGVGLRVLVNGAWGFASTPNVHDVREMNKLADIATALAKANAAVSTKKIELAPTRTSTCGRPHFRGKIPSRYPLPTRPGCCSRSASGCAW